jgi:hypothetical protein
LLCLRNARAFPLLPAALASVPFGFVLVRVRVQFSVVVAVEMRVPSTEVGIKVRTLNRGLCSSPTPNATDLIL